MQGDGGDEGVAAMEAEDKRESDEAPGEPVAEGAPEPAPDEAATGDPAGEDANQADAPEQDNWGRN